MDELTATEIAFAWIVGSGGEITLKFHNNPAEAPLFELARASHQIILDSKTDLRTKWQLYRRSESAALEKRIQIAFWFKHSVRRIPIAIEFRISVFPSTVYKRSGKPACFAVQCGKESPTFRRQSTRHIPESWLFINAVVRLYHTRRKRHRARLQDSTFLRTWDIRNDKWRET